MNSDDERTREQDMDALLADVRNLLEGFETPEEQHDESAPEADVTAPEQPEEQTLPEELPVQSAPAAPKQYLDPDAYDEFDELEEDTPDAVKEAFGTERPTFYEQSKSAYQNARRAEYRRERERERQARAQQRQAQEKEDLARMRRRDIREKKQTRRTAAEYAEWLYQQGLGEEPAKRGEQEPGSGRRKKRRSGFGSVFLVLLILVALCTAAFHFLLARPPVSGDAYAERKPGCSSILVAGVDEAGFRTDTMMLVQIDRENRLISLVSIPRDTLIFCEYSVPKLNSAYGWASGGEKGVEELMTRVTEIIGFRPDGYVIVDLPLVAELIDEMGGVTFDVPMRMEYEDPRQNLVIDLQPGLQKLTGEQALQALRFRSGYADADLGRVRVQRELLSAAIRQWVSLKGALHLPDAMELVQEHASTDLSRSNLLWLAESFLICDRSSIRTATLPGESVYLTGSASGWYYVLDAEGVAGMVNELCNPYVKGVTAQELYVRAG